MFTIGNWTRGLAIAVAGIAIPLPPESSATVQRSVAPAGSGGDSEDAGMMVDQARLTVGTKHLPERPGASELVADGLLSVVDAARFLSVSRSKLYEMMDAVPRRAVVELAAGGLRGGHRA